MFTVGRSMSVVYSFLIAVVGVALLMGLTAAPASAAKRCDPPGRENRGVEVRVEKWDCSWRGCKKLTVRTVCVPISRNW